MKRLGAHLDARSWSAKEGQSGQVLVLLAVFIVGLLAFMALAFDGGNTFLQRRRMQNAADAGALAGTRILCGGGDAAAAQAEAQGYAGANGAGSAQVTINPNGATVVACTNVQMTFAPIIGLYSVNVCARASAECVPLDTWNGLAPLALLYDPNYIPGYCLTIWDSDVEGLPGGVSGSRRGWLNVSCYNLTQPCCCGVAAASNLKNWMGGGYSGAVIIPSYMLGDNGVKNAVTMAATVGQQLRIPLYDSGPDANGYYHVVALGLFQVTAVDFQGSPKGITGCFVGWVGPGAPGSGPNVGVQTFHLTE